MIPKPCGMPHPYTFYSSAPFQSNQMAPGTLSGEDSPRGTQVLLTFSPPPRETEPGLSPLLSHRAPSSHPPDQG